MIIRDSKHTLVVTHADLSNSTFADVNLHAAQFTDVNLSKARFTDINLSGSEFKNVNLANVEIEDCETSGLKISGILVSDLIAAFKRTGLVQQGGPANGIRTTLT